MCFCFGSAQADPFDDWPRTGKELHALDQAAKNALQRIQQRSIRYNVEFCGFIKRTETGRFEADKPRSGAWAGCTLPETEGDLPVANYHTHSAYSTEADSEVPSVMDLRSDIEDGVIGYISTPGGRLWRTNKPRGVAIQLCGEGCMISDPNYVPSLDMDPVRKRYTLRELMARQGE